MGADWLLGMPGVRRLDAVAPDQATQEPTQ
jgi:hypothetical protein